MIEIKNLTKRYGNKLAVDDVSFTVNKGEILGFLGPNGAGKSTTMNILTGYLSATEGQAIIDGFDILENPTEAKKKIGYLPEQPPLYVDMTVDEYLDFMYDLKKVRVGASKKTHISEICELVKISHVRKRMIRNLSKGYKQRVGIAQALLGNPEVLILDEPTVGLDPKQIIEIRTLIKSLSESHTVILSSHILPEIQAVCDRVIVISQGRLVADDTETNLSNKLSDDVRYTIRIDGPEKEVLSMLRSIPAMTEVQALGKREKGVYEYIIEAEKGFDIRREVFKRLSSRNWPIMSLKSSELTLEDIFLQLTEGRTDINMMPAAEKEPEEKAEPAAEAEEQEDGGDEE
ncbi:ABC transporter ATP-binding protein [Massiliimalia massiliensis]|uniref:ABC transporter ATP-binding protein n=1 Tax=Massiliimalia massiliensis TaxID=1852384 RepID=UPI000986FA3E|nr:ATP-binding cassette domain-containing protein [Massiliimalia massiliensis]